MAAFAILWFTRIERETVQRRSNNFFEIIGLLKNKYVSECFLLILMSVGFEICLTTLVPEHFSKVLSVSVEKGGMACSVYYIMKMTGTLLGTFILSRLPASKFLKYTTAGLLLSFIGYWLSHTAFFLYLFLILIGLFGANVFAVAFSIALQHSSDRPNDVSALMIAALAGGAFLPPLMGVISDAVGFVASFIIPGIVALVMAVISFRIYGQE